MTARSSLESQDLGAIRAERDRLRQRVAELAEQVAYLLEQAWGGDLVDDDLEPRAFAGEFGPLPDWIEMQRPWVDD